METFLLLLPAIFSFFTGILISWGLYLCVVLHMFSDEFKEDQHNPMKNMCLIIVSLSTIFLFLLLFIFIDFASFHMVTILFIEIWYANFLYRITISPWNTPCHIFISSLLKQK